jgi:hypothetical protein
MKPVIVAVLIAVACPLGTACRAVADDQFAVALPAGVKAVWDISKA